MSRCRAGAVIAVAALMLAGCGGTLFESDKVEYKSESGKKLPPLEVPPDLTAPAQDDRYQVPEPAAAGAATFSAYTAERSGVSRPGAAGILPEFEKMRIERSGSERWLVVPAPPEKVWPIVKDFWEKNGFAIVSESPETGVMETDWAENRAKIKQDVVRNLLGSVLGNLYSSGERDKFRTRLERGSQPDTTEIYVSHRGMVEVYVSESQDRTAWQPRPPDPGLEAEFLRRLLVRFGAPEGRARAQLAPQKTEEQAKIVQAADGPGTLELAEPFDRAWRRVGLILDRMGFTVEDRDRSKGFYFVRYVDPEADAKKKDEGALSKLMFWRSAPEPKAQQYRVFVKDRKEASEVQVLDKEGNPDRSDTARRILALLQNQLK